MNLLNRYGGSERFIAQATVFPEYILARVVAQIEENTKLLRKSLLGRKV